MENSNLKQGINESLERAELAVEKLIEAKVSNAILSERNRMLGYLVGWNIILTPSQIQTLTRLGEDE